MLSFATYVALTAHVFFSGGGDHKIPFEKYVLETNGLQVILAHDPSLPVVAVNV